MNMHGVSDSEQMEMCTAAQLVPSPSLFEVEIAIAKLKSINRQTVIKFQQN
jgi:hypothetical protein